MLKIDELANKWQMNKEKPPCTPHHGVMNSLVLKLNKSCNLNCSYCYVDPIKAKDKIEEMDFEMIQSMLRSCFSKYEFLPQKPFMLFLHGGEPLLSYGLIKRIVQFINEIGYSDKVHFMLQTNGTIMNEDMIEFFKEHHIALGISLDGYNHRTNGHRLFYDETSSFDIVSANIKKCIEKGLQVGVASVITDKNVTELLELSKYLYGLGVNSAVFNLLVPNGRASEETSIVHDFTASMKQVYSWSREVNFVERGLFYLERALFSGDQSYMCGKAPCGAGRNTLGIDTNGDVTLCDQLIGDSRFVIGHVSKLNHLNIENHEVYKTFQNRVPSNIESCATCGFSDVCPLGCPAHSIYRDEDILSQPILCDYYKEMYKCFIATR